MPEGRRGDSDRPPASWTGRGGSILLLSVLALLLHANAMDAFFTGDDFDILRQTVAQESLGEALRMEFVGNWRPLSFAQFYLNHRLGGLDPRIYHLTNLFWHVVTILALFGFVRSAWPGQPAAAWVAALLFATHPSNDQAITYICARSHSIAAALAVVAMFCHARFRLRSAGTASKATLFALALLATFLAGTTKESTLTLPVWIAAFEWLLARRDEDPVLHSVGRALAWSVPYMLAALSVFPVRRLVVGGLPPGLDDAPEGAGELLARLVAEIPIYGLKGGLPVPFSWVDRVAIDRMGLVAWAVVLAMVAAGFVCFRANAIRPANRSAALYVLGCTIAATSVLPVVYADLDLQRRYLYIANVGFVLMAVAALHALRERVPRTALGLVLVLLVAGAVGTVQRNELYRRSGDIVRNLVETAYDASIEDLQRRPAFKRHHAIVTLPRYYGGDDTSGVLTLSRTDFHAAMDLFGSTWPSNRFALKCYHADDYSAEVTLESETEGVLRVSFRTRRAYEASLARDPLEDRRGSAVVARLLSSDDDNRVLRYRLRLGLDFWDKYRVLLVYSDGRFLPLRRPTPSSGSRVGSRRSR